MRSRRAVRALAGFVLAGAAAAGCSTTTNGTGQAAVTPTGPTSPSTHVPRGTAITTLPSVSVAVPRTPPAPVHPAPAQPLRTAVVHASGGSSYVIEIWADVKNASCVDHAYGPPIITFLARHPCSGLERYLATTTVGGRPVGFAESATGFPGTARDPYRWASRFARLEQANGTGSLNDLLREGYRLPSGPTAIPRSEAFDVITQDNGVTVWDAWYLNGDTPPNDPALIKMTQDAFLQF